MKIRRLAEREIPRIVEFLVNRFHAEFADTLPPVNPQKVVASAYGTWRDGVILIAEDDGAIVGSIALVPSGWWFSDAGFIADRWFYVAPEARGGPAWRALLDAAEGLSEREWKQKLRPGVSAGGRHDAKDRLFRRAGYDRVATLYEKKGA